MAIKKGGETPPFLIRPIEICCFDAVGSPDPVKGNAAFAAGQGAKRRQTPKQTLFPL